MRLDYYLEKTLDGLFVHAGQGDDLLASLDNSFWQDLGPAKGKQCWKDYFFKKNNSIDFIDQCEEFFSRSGRPIENIVEARWWFYLICKFSIGQRSTLLQEPGKIQTPFFDSKIFEDYMYYNTDKIITTNNYNSYKQFIKEYILEFDQNQYYHQHKCKENSGQLQLYTRKRDILKNCQTIMWLSDGSRVFVDSLPFLSESIYKEKYKGSLNYLFNQA